MRIFAKLIVFTGSLLIHFQSGAQGLHFSQYYNAPMLLNPANTALMSENDFRIGANYREQWGSLPVPYRTISAFADFQAFRKEEEESNWLGVGFAFFGDRAGDGMLSALDMRMTLAYHIHLNEISMLSAGLYGGYVQRSVDFNRLTFDLQWDGYSFNRDLGNGEKLNMVKTGYLDVGAGLNYAYFPDKSNYFKLGIGLAHVNVPNETFYGMSNHLGVRPMINADAITVIDANTTLNPSAYLAFQRGATEIVYGMQLLFTIMTDNEFNSMSDLIIGGYHRWNDAAIGVIGIRYNGMKFTFSYDYTISRLRPYNGGQGAAEFSFIYMGNYRRSSRIYRAASCPRF